MYIRVRIYNIIGIYWFFPLMMTKTSRIDLSVACRALKRQEQQSLDHAEHIP